jgi:hypothetical protein
MHQLSIGSMPLPRGAGPTHCNGFLQHHALHGLLQHPNHVSEDTAGFRRILLQAAPGT